MKKGTKILWSWVFKSQIRSLLFAFLVGGLWTFISIRMSGDAETVVASLVTSLAFVIDITAVFLIVFSCSLFGISINTMDAWMSIWIDAKGYIFKRYAWAVFMSIALGTLGVHYSRIFEFQYDNTAVIATMVVLTSTLAFMTAYRTHHLYSIMTKKERKSYLYEEGALGFVKRLGRIWIPWLDKSRASMSFIWAAPVSALSVVLAYQIARVNEIDSGSLMPLYLSLILGVSFSIIATIYRVADHFRPGKRRYSMYAYFDKTYNIDANKED